MIRGRLHWKERVNAAPAKRSKRDLATFEFDNGRLTLTEAALKDALLSMLLKAKRAFAI